MISKKITSHKDLTSEFVWIGLNIALSKYSSKRVCGNVKLLVGVETFRLQLTNSCIYCKSKLRWTWCVIDVEMWDSNPYFITFFISLSLEFLCEFYIR